jgi:phospholipase C
MSDEWKLTRRDALKGAGALGAIGAAAALPGAASAMAHKSSRRSALARRAGRKSRLPVEHIVLDCQENRSFDHYFGFAPWIGRYGVPPGLQPARWSRRVGDPASLHCLLYR